MRTRLLKRHFTLSCLLRSAFTIMLGSFCTGQLVAEEAAPPSEPGEEGTSESLSPEQGTEFLRLLASCPDDAGNFEPQRAEFLKFVEPRADAVINFLKSPLGSPHEDHAGRVLVGGKPSPELATRVLRRFSSISVRIQAARILIPLRKKESAPGLADLLEQPDFPSPIWKEIWSGLAEVDPEQALKTAIATLQRDEKPTRTIAADGIVKLADDSTADWLLMYWRGRAAGLSFQAMQQQDFLLKAFVLLNSEILAPAVDRFLKAERDGQVRNRLIYFLHGANPAAAVPILLGILKEPGEEEVARRQAIYALAQVRSKEAVSALLDFLSESDTEVFRLDVVCALMKVDEEFVDVDGLWERLKHHADTPLEQVAAALLIGSSKAGSLSKAQAMYLRELAWQQMGDADANLRKFGADLLVRASGHYEEGQNDLLKAIGPVAEAGLDKTLLVRKFAEGPRTEDGFKSMAEILDRGQEAPLRAAALAYLARHASGEELRQHSTQILKLLSDPSQWLGATLAMAKDGSEESRAELERLIADESISPDTRRKITSILSSIGHQDRSK